MTAHISTFLQIDLQYLFNASRNEHQRVDFEKMWTNFNSRENETLIDAVVYMIQSPDFDIRKFESKIQQIGYITKVKSTAGARSYRYMSPNANIIVESLSPRFDIEEFERGLERMGYNTKIRASAKTRSYSYVNNDVSITVDCMNKINLFDKWILMSGSESFVDLAACLRKNGKIVELWTYKGAYSPMLEPYVSKMNFINEDFYYKKPPSEIEFFGFGTSSIKDSVE